MIIISDFLSCGMNFRKAKKDDISIIWKIIQEAISRRKNDGSDQWQDGYPNLEIIQQDISLEKGYVLEVEKEIVGYIVLLINNEPAYEKIDGKWLTTGDFVVFHRIAVGEKHIQKGYAMQMMIEVERFANEQQLPSIKFDTNFDNQAMLRLAEKLNYTYCGEVMMRTGVRKAFEKIIF